MQKKMLTMAGAVLILVLLSGMQPAVQAQDEELTLGWTHTAELGWVLTAGNSDTSTLGFGYSGKRTWEKALFQVKLGGVTAENSTTYFIEPAPGAPVVEADETSKTAENYYLTARYDRTISHRLFWYGGGAWLRNEFAGIENRFTVSGGVGHNWFDTDDRSFRTSYGVSYTDQSDVLDTPGMDNSYIGLLVGWNYSNKFGENTVYTNDFGFNYNLDESKDWRWVMDQSVAVSMTERLALKVTLAWLYDNLPALGSFELRDPAGNVLGTTVQPLEELDTVLSVSLVINF